MYCMVPGRGSLGEQALRRTAKQGGGENALAREEVDLFFIKGQWWVDRH